MNKERLSRKHYYNVNPKEKENPEGQEKDGHSNMAWTEKSKSREEEEQEQPPLC